VYDDKLWRWTGKRFVRVSKAPVGRGSTCVADRHGAVYVVGGADRKTGDYDGQITKVEGGTVTPLPKCPGGHGAGCATETSLVVVNGDHAVHVLELATRKWKRPVALKVKARAPTLCLVPLSGERVAIFGDGH
jgi:hypothetical protein